ncbi:uncharacterized protein K444DRAFT_542241, partial [Hyaloscypha bicolor E]
NYLLYRFPRTRKSNLNLAITSYFNLNIYILNLFIISKAILKRLFNSFLSYYIIFLEDINIISSN